MKASITLPALLLISNLLYGQNNLKFMNSNDSAKHPHVCKLTSHKLQQRKKTIIDKMKRLVLQKEETNSGYKFKFDGTDAVIDMLTSFIKTERLCCEFFTYMISAGDENSFVWFELSGPEGAKEFITTELGF